MNKEYVYSPVQSAHNDKALRETEVNCCCVHIVYRHDTSSQITLNNVQMWIDADCKCLLHLFILMLKSSTVTILSATL